MLTGLPGVYEVPAMPQLRPAVSDGAMAPSMSQQSTTRPVSAAERRQLARLAEATRGRIASAARSALVVWAGTALIVFTVWLSLAWPVRLMGGKDVGLQSGYAPWVFGVGVPLCALYALLSTLRAFKHRPDLRKLLQADLDHGDVVEESYRLTGAKRFQEPEHGGLLYFLHTADDRVLVIYDAESRDLGVRGKNPLTSGFRPRTQLSMVRAPMSRVLLSESFTGEPLDAGEPIELAAPPKDWPESGAYCDIAWMALEQRLGSSPDRDS
jgi:hypothetical protein